MKDVVVLDFMYWLDSHLIDYTIRRQDRDDDGDGDDGYDFDIYIDFGGPYVRVSDFSENGHCYVRDTGFINWMSMFELTELILDYHNKSKKEN